MSDPWWRLENLYYILDENGNRQRFKLRPAQKLFIAGLWYRNIILKARQLGFTSVIAIFALDRCLFNRNFHAGIIAHTKDDVIKIFESKVRFAYDNLPPDLAPMVVAHTDRANELKFPNGSSIRVAVSMRSGTLQLLHISEYGKLWAQFPKKAKEVQTGSLPTVHDKGITIIESTAEGVGGDYHAKCVRAEIEAKSIAAGNRGPLSSKEYRFHFFAWWANPNYQLNVPFGFTFNSRDEEYFSEVEQIIEKPLSPEQRYWYVVTQEELDETLMKQEHPSYPEEAFLFSGRKAFEGKDLKTAEKQCLKPMWQGDINPETGVMEARRDGPLLLWAHPVEHQEYAIGADVAEGLEKGDYSSMDVLDDTGHQVAHYRGHIDTDSYGKILNHIGLYYRKATLGVERNNHGHAVLLCLKYLKYPKLYMQQVQDRRGTNDEASGDRIGWLTTQVSKPFIIDNLKTLLKQGQSGVRNVDTVSEMHQFIIDERGRFMAQDNCYDDRVMSYAIAHEVLRTKPRKSRVFKFDRKPKDWRAR